MATAGRIALVTGAASGIGAAIAKELAAAGAHVVGADTAWSADHERAPGDGSGDGSGIERVRCDVADPASVTRLIANIAARHGGVDILVNNAAFAGTIPPTPFEQITPEEWDRVMANNARGPFLCTRAVVPRMREKKWGRIVNLTSATIFLGTPMTLHYNASKGAVAVMTRSLAKELGGDGITVNAIAPGLTVTEGIAQNPSYTDEMLKGAVAQRAIPREERAEDLTGTCLFLVSDAAEFITGQIITVDGGTAFP